MDNVKGEVHAYVDGTIAGEIRPVKGSESEANDNDNHEDS